MKPVSYHKIALRYLDLCYCHFGALVLLKGTLGVFLVVCCQCELCARGSLLGAFVSLLGFKSLGKGLCRDSGKRSVVENFGERVVLLLKCCSPSLKQNAAVPGH